MVFRTCPVLVTALFSANLAFASNSQCSDFNTAAAQVFEISQYQDARIATYASGFAVEEELLENVSRFTNITVGSMPPPRANQQPGENWFYLCMAKEGLGWNELKSIVQEYLSGEILGEEAREKLQDAIDCYERQSTAPPSEDIEKTETRLPPPLFVYGSSRNAGNTTLVVRAVYDNAEDVEIASAPFYDYGFGDNRQSYPFGVGGILIGACVAILSQERLNIRAALSFIPLRCEFSGYLDSPFDSVPCRPMLLVPPSFSCTKSCFSPLPENKSHPGRARSDHAYPGRVP
eukprot:6177864-Pleurochrysis_carterae.AAC.2